MAWRIEVRSAASRAYPNEREFIDEMLAPVRPAARDHRLHLVLRTPHWRVYALTTAAQCRRGSNVAPFDGKQLCAAAHNCF
jgi:hypothetical protein